MKVSFRLFFKVLSLASLLILGGCPQLTTGAISGGGTPLSATGEKTVEKGASDKDLGSEDTIAPPAARDEAAANTAMMRRMDAPSGDDRAGDPIIVARESAGGILGAPSAEERLEEPDYRLVCNVLAVEGPLSGRSWTDSDDFLRKLAAGTLNVAQVRTLCDLQQLNETPGLTTERAEAEAIEYFRGTGIGYYLFFRKNDRGDFEGRYVGDDKTFASNAELRAALADTQYIGEKVVAAASLAAPIAPERRRELAPRSTLPVLQDTIRRLP